MHLRMRKGVRFAVSAVLSLALLLLLLLGCNGQHSGTDPNGDTTGTGIDDSNLVKFDGTGHFDPAWSTTGRLIAYLNSFADSQGFARLVLETVDLDSGVIATVRDVTDLRVYDMSWSPDGDWILLAGTQGVSEIKPDGTELKTLVPGEGLDSPSWSSTSNRIYYASNAGDIGIYSILPNGSDIQKHSSMLTKPACYPSSDSLLAGSYQSSQMCVSRFSPESEQDTATIYCGFSKVARLRMSYDLVKVYYIGEDLSPPRIPFVYEFDRSTGDNRKVCDGFGFDLSPSGDSLVFSDLLHSKGLKILDLISGDTTQVTHFERRGSSYETW